MFCRNCGIQLPDDANFCLKCGYPQKDNISTDEIKWETCETDWVHVKPGTLFSKGTAKYIARAIGPQGQYIAGQSSEYTFAIPETEVITTARFAAFDSFIKQLVAEGWEFIGSFGVGDSQKRFRRRVK
ncbi:MAG: zinc ribbon domain-containing protein [Anaerolineaceae bacterium]|nr:MAG: zinc ribbon domain-containing protein [Anaerolineaceae bacterium]